MSPLAAIRSYRPRRADGLPNGQREVSVWPRFSDEPFRWAPALGEPTVQIEAGDPAETSLDLANTDAVFVERTHDFHCVTTWSYRGVCWGGYVLVDLLAAAGVETSTLPRFARAVGADDRHAIFVTEDLLDPSVLLATHADGQLLTRRHGGAVRLVSPKQYGYKNVKHLRRIEFSVDQPDSSFGKKEHLRARVANEERHSTLPNWMVRLPYRVTVVPTALAADRGLANSPR